MFITFIYLPFSCFFILFIMFINVPIIVFKSVTNELCSFSLITSDSYNKSNQYSVSLASFRAMLSLLI